MTSQQVKIEKKRNKRKKILANKQAHARRQAALQLFPEVFYKNEGASPAFFDAVHQAMREFVRDHTKLFGKRATELMRTAKKIGFPYVLHSLARAEGRPVLESLQVATFACMLGEPLMHSLRNATGDLFFPCHDCCVIPGKPRANTILVRCRALMDFKTRGGTAYFSPWKPTVRLDVKEWIVAFYRHAIERICDRAVQNWRSYGGWGDVFAFLYNCVYFKPCRFPKGDVGFSLFQKCSPSYVSYFYAEQILGKLDPKKTYYYRVGYCPVIREGAFAVAKTLLIPGMRGTPEHAIICKMAGDFDQRLNLERRVKRHTLRGLIESPDFGLIRSFHQGGVLQVISLDQEVFRTGSIDKIGLM